MNRESKFVQPFKQANPAKTYLSFKEINIQHIILPKINAEFRESFFGII
jgi:hypothetical protein